MDQALGLIETKGLVAAIEAADAMVKAADVSIISKEKVTGALVIIKVSGETAAVKAAIDAGTVAAQRVGELISAHVIPRPDNQIDPLLYDSALNFKNRKDEKKVDKIKSEVKPESSPKVSSKPTKSRSDIKEDSPSRLNNKIKTEDKKTEKSKTNSKQKIPTLAELEILNVHSLRKVARSFENFPIKGREISKANRGQLLDYFKSMQK